MATKLRAVLKIGRSQVVILLLLVAGLYGVIPQLGDFSGSLNLLRHPNWALVVAAAGLFGLTYVAAALTYLLLAFKKLPYVRTVWIEMASMFVGRLVPAGLGTLGANFAYLRAQKHSQAQAAAVLGVNNLLGIVGHGTIVAAALLAFPRARHLVRAPHLGVSSGAIAVIVVVVVLLVCVAAWLGRRTITAALTDVGAQLATYGTRKARVGLALLSSMSLTTCNMLCFYVCAQALGVDITLLAAVLIFSLGIGIGSSVPTPGGIGGAEAGLLAGLLATGALSTAALATVVLFRLISYWLALAVGLAAFIDCQRRGWFSV